MTLGILLVQSGGEVPTIIHEYSLFITIANRSNMLELYSEVIKIKLIKGHSYKLHYNMIHCITSQDSAQPEWVLH